MKIIYLIFSHSLSVVLGVIIYHKFFMNYLGEKLVDYILNEVYKAYNEEREFE